MSDGDSTRLREQRIDTELACASCSGRGLSLIR